MGKKKEENDTYIEVGSRGKLILPSEKAEKKRNSPIRKTLRQTGNTVSKMKWIIIICIIILIYFSYDKIMGSFIDLLKQNPTIYRYYLGLESHVNNNTIFGIYLISILGALFFMVLPSEALFIYYLSSTDYFAGIIVLLVIFGCLTGLSFNYLFGRLLGERVLKVMFRKKFYDYKEKIDKYGGYFLFFGNIFPGPIEVLAVFYGGFKFGFWRFLYLSMIGRTIKYLVLFIAFYFFWDQILFYYNGVLNGFEELKMLFLK